MTTFPEGSEAALHKNFRAGQVEDDILAEQGSDFTVVVATQGLIGDGEDGPFGGFVEAGERMADAEDIKHLAPLSGIGLKVVERTDSGVFMPGNGGKKCAVLIRQCHRGR